MSKTKENDKPYKNIEVDKKKNGVVEIEGEIRADTLKEYKERVLNEIQKDYEKEGFRKGKVPTDMILEEVGEEHVLNEAAREALDAVYPLIIKERDLDIMSRPRVQITKLATGNPLGFKIHVAISPEIKLPNYKKIAKKIREEKKKESDNIEVEDEEVERVIKYIQSQHAQREALENDEGTPKVPELTDEFVKQLGDFENVEDFKRKMKENITEEKRTVAKRQIKEEIAEKLVEEADFEIPDLTIESELQSQMERFLKSLEEKETSLEDYLEKVDKTEEEFVEEQRDNIRKQIKTRLIFEAIADKEELEADEEQVKQRLKAMQQYQPDADPALLREYIEKSLKNQKVMEMLGEPED